LLDTSSRQRRYNEMKLEDLIKRADELIQLGEGCLKNRTRGVGSDYPIGTGKLTEFRSASLSFLSRTFGLDSPYYTEFDTKIIDRSASHIRAGMGILTACRDEIAGGWLFTARGLIASDLFKDFLQMAEYLLSGDYKDASAVIIGSVLEEHLRQLCAKNGISVVDSNGRPRKASALNDDLARGTYDKLEQKAVTYWLDLRNKAAHGEYKQYDKDQVANMLQGVRDFMGRHTA